MISLKTFHLFFIALSIVLTLGFAVYEIRIMENGSSYVLAGLSFMASIGLVIYGIKVYKKFRTLS